MGQAMSITVRPLTPETWPDFVALLSDSAGCDGCWCLNHHLRPDAPDVRGDAAREEKQRLLEAGRAGGLLAYRDDKPVGWCAIDPRGEIPGHDCVGVDEDKPQASIPAIHCFYIHPDARGQGVATALLDGALAHLAASGSDVVEAYPSPPEQPLAFGGFAGPYALFDRFGFALMEEMGPDYCRVGRRLPPESSTT